MGDSPASHSTGHGHHDGAVSASERDAVLHYLDRLDDLDPDPALRRRMQSVRARFTAATPRGPLSPRAAD